MAASERRSVMEEKMDKIIAVQKARKDKQELLADGIAATAPVVMLSGSFGSGVGELAEKLSRRIQSPFYGPRRLGNLSMGLEVLRDGIIPPVNEPHEDLANDFFDYWLGYLHESVTVTARERLIKLSDTIREIASNGGVVAGVCPHMVLPGKKLLRVRVEASTQFCARRLSSILSVDEEEARRVFLKLEGERRQFLRESFEESFIDAIEYDLVLHAEKSTMEEMLDTCLKAMHRKGMLVKGRRG
ncbi:MAG: cytidylate kinase-like family protein [Magnetococcus sp. MYC-9]